jgi:hypothetical protein
LRNLLDLNVSDVNQTAEGVNSRILIVVTGADVPDGQSDPVNGSAGYADFCDSVTGYLVRASKSYDVR